MSLVRHGWFPASFALAALACAAPPPGQVNLRIYLAESQPGSPVRIVSTTSTTRCLFDSVQIVNVSSSPLYNVRFGMWLVPSHRFSRGPAAQKPVLIEGRPLSFAALAPGAKRTLKVHLAPLKDLLERERSVMARYKIAEVGLLAAGSGSGSYTYDPALHHGFGPLVSLLRDDSAMAIHTAAYNPSGRPLFAGFASDQNVAGPYCGDSASGGSPSAACSWPELLLH